MNICKFCEKEIKDLRVVYCDSFLSGVICCIGCQSKGREEASQTREYKEEQEELSRKRSTWHNQINKEKC